MLRWPLLLVASIIKYSRDRLTKGHQTLRPIPTAEGKLRNLLGCLRWSLLSSVNWILQILMFILYNMCFYLCICLILYIFVSRQQVHFISYWVVSFKWSERLYQCCGINLQRVQYSCSTSRCLDTAVSTPRSDLRLLISALTLGHHDTVDHKLSDSIWFLLSR